MVRNRWGSNTPSKALHLLIWGALNNFCINAFFHRVFLGHTTLWTIRENVKGLSTSAQCLPAICWVACMPGYNVRIVHHFVTCQRLMMKVFFISYFPLYCCDEILSPFSMGTLLSSISAWHNSPDVPGGSQSVFSNILPPQHRFCKSLMACIIGAPCE